MRIQEKTKEEQEEFWSKFNMISKEEQKDFLSNPVKKLSDKSSSIKDKSSKNKIKKTINEEDILLIAKKLIESVDGDIDEAKHKIEIIKKLKL